MNKISLVILNILLVTSLYTLLHLSTAPSDTISVDVASTSVFKINAVIKAFQKSFATNSIKVNKYKVPSHVPEQPVGELAGIEGALNRINELPLKSHAEWALSIESYIQYVPKSDCWYDIGCIVLLNRLKSNKIIFFTKPTLIPTKYVEMAKKISEVTSKGYSVTAGELINKEFPNILKDNWHADAMFGGISRDILLEQAIYKALKYI